MPASTPPAASDVYELAWQEVEKRWAEDGAHRKFIALCAAQGALQEAGRRYKAVRDGDPSRANEAEARINAVLAAALQSMDLTRTARVPRKSRLQWIIVGLMLFFLVYAVLQVLRAAPR